MGAQRITRGNPTAPYLRWARLERKLTQREVADRMGVSVRTVQRYERDGLAGTTGVMHVFAVCKAYGVQVDKLTALIPA